LCYNVCTKKKVWTFDEFKTNIKNGKVSSMVKPLVMTSEEAVARVKTPVQFIFIDGDQRKIQKS
jgi:hypothetical protein